MAGENKFSSNLQQWSRFQFARLTARAEFLILLMRGLCNYDTSDGEWPSFIDEGSDQEGGSRGSKFRGGPWRTRCFDQSAMSILSQSAMGIFSQSAMSIFSRWAMSTCNVRHTLTRNPEIAPDTRCFYRQPLFRPDHVIVSLGEQSFHQSSLLSPLVIVIMRHIFWS